MTDTSDRFDWAHDDSVVIREQPATAVYTNTSGDIVIRQANAQGDDDDAFIFLRPENVQALVDTMLAELSTEKPPLSNAERQRRYRERHRNEVTEFSLRTISP
jgi:hypothetical protein